MPATKIMLLRHAEKPAIGGSDIGVDEFGHPSARSLSVRGWQRAGALARFFGGPAGSSAPAQGIAQPNALFAASAADIEDSLRPSQTVMPVARLLGLDLNTSFRKDEVDALVEALKSQFDGVALLSWEHRAIPAIAKALLGKARTSPKTWPQDRFDLVWIFDREDGGYVFSQTAQMLLAGDSTEPAESGSSPR